MPVVGDGFGGASVVLQDNGAQAGVVRGLLRDDVDGRLPRPLGDGEIFVPQWRTLEQTIYTKKYICYERFGCNWKRDPQVLKESPTCVDKWDIHTKQRCAVLLLSFVFISTQPVAILQFQSQSEVCFSGRSESLIEIMGWNVMSNAPQQNAAWIAHSFINSFICSLVACLSRTHDADALTRSSNKGFKIQLENHVRNRQQTSF